MAMHCPEAYSDLPLDLQHAVTSIRSNVDQALDWLLPTLQDRMTEHDPHSHAHGLVCCHHPIFATTML